MEKKNKKKNKPKTLEVTSVCVFAVYAATAGDVARLHSDLFANYRRVIPPVLNQTSSVSVRLSLFLLMIHDLVSRSVSRTCVRRHCCCC